MFEGAPSRDLDVVDDVDDVDDDDDEGDGACLQAAFGQIRTISPSEATRP